MKQDQAAHLDLAGTLRTARDIQKRLSSAEAGGTTVDLTISGGKGGGGGGGGVVGGGGGSGVIAKKCVFVIRSETADEAYEHAKDLEDQGCTCVSSGATEVTCTCEE